MSSMSVRLLPVGRAEVITPEDRTPTLRLVENGRLLFTLTPRHFDEVSDEEMEAARSLLAALRVFVEHAGRWTVPSALQTPTTVGGAA